MLEEYLWIFGAAELSSLASRGGLVSDTGCNISALLINKEKLSSNLVH